MSARAGGGSSSGRPLRPRSQRWSGIHHKQLDRPVDLEASEPVPAQSSKQPPPPPPPRLLLNLPTIVFFHPVRSFSSTFHHHYLHR
eukprot:766615-Hanusia_phi.AAC.5